MTPDTKALSELVEALRACHLELYWCAKQLAARGAPGRPGDSASRALEQAGSLLSSLSPELAGREG